MRTALRLLLLATVITAAAILIGSLLTAPASAPPPPSSEGRPAVPTATVEAGSLPTVDTARPLPRAKAARQGEVLATMRIPALGADWRYDVIEGIRDADLDRGMAHYPMTPLPGARGNVAFAGHRWEGPLYDFERLVEGSHIIIEQRGARWVYEVVTPVQRVLPSDTWVIDPVPGHPRERMLTLTTCWPKNGSSHREFVRARLIHPEEP